jgi:hypothetical protein
MTDNNYNIQQLNEKLERLLNKQTEFSKEISDLQTAIRTLNEMQLKATIAEKQAMHTEEISTKPETLKNNPEPTTVKEIPVLEPFVLKPQYSAPTYSKTPGQKSDLEKFILKQIYIKSAINRP